MRQALLVTLFVITALPAQGQDWSRLDGPVNGNAPWSYLAKMTFDEARSRTVVVEQNGETWDWDGVSWLHHRGITGPSAYLWGAEQAYDTIRQRVMWVGSRQGTAFETWAWDGAGWTQLGNLPQTGSGIGLAFDAWRGRLVAFAGGTWEWDGTTWTRLQPGVEPLSNGPMAFDRVRGKTVLLRMDVATLGVETWEWDGVAWMLRNNVATLPVSVTGMSVGLMWHAARGRVIAYVDTQQVRGIWEWDGAQWRSLATGGPPTRVSASIAFDALRGQVLVFGGVDAANTNPMHDFWSWDGTTWSRRSEATAAGRRAYAAGYDLVRQRLVLTGGWSGGGWSVPWSRQPGTSVWDGRQWSLATSNPALRGDGAMAPDPLLRGLLLFGGEADLGNPLSYSSRNDTWLWNGAAWSQLFPATVPRARALHGMVHDLARQRIVMFGGIDSYTCLDDTWEWNGSDWSRVVTTMQPSPRSHLAMAYDPARQRTVLFGGTDRVLRFDDTWEWDGSTWTQRQPVTRPPAGDMHGMTCDLVSQRVILAVPTYVGAPTVQTWSWDGIDWTRLVTASEPPQSQNSPVQLVFDTAAGKVLLHDGRALWMLTPVPARVTAYGSGCSSARLVGAGDPRPGGRCSVDVVGAPAGAGVVLGFGPGPASQPIGGGCTLLVQQPFSLRWLPTGPSGFATTSIDLPPNRLLAGTSLSAQAVHLDQSLLGFAVTNGLRLDAGN